MSSAPLTRPALLLLAALGAGVACEDAPEAPPPEAREPLTFDEERVFCESLHRAVVETEDCDAAVARARAVVPATGLRVLSERSREQSGENAARWDAAVSLCADALMIVRRACVSTPEKMDALREVLNPVQAQGEEPR